MSMDRTDQAKRMAAAHALTFVEDGMRLGLGTGSTARHFVDLLGARVRAGLDVICVPTSEATAMQAEALGIVLTTLEATPHLDITVDGADELDNDRALIKGGGGALLREKIVAAASDRMIVIADESKHVARLGAFPLPVEIAPFGAGATMLALKSLFARLGYHDAQLDLRQRAGAHFITDGGHYIVDCAIGSISDARALAARLSTVPGVIEHGLFIDLARCVILSNGETTQLLGTCD